LLAYGYSDGADEVVKYQAAKTGTFLLSVYQYGGDPTSDTTGYTLTIVIEPDYVCTDDAFEENDSAWGAYELPQSYLNQDLKDLHLCAGDADWYSVELLPGQGLSASIDFDQAAGDLDLYLLEPDGESVVDSSATSDPQESVSLVTATQGGLYYLVVEGYPAETTENTYTLRVDLKGGPACQPDELEGNDDAAHATGIPGDSSWQGLTLCGDDDWFTTTVYPFETFMAEAQATGGTVTLEVRGPGGTSVLASGSGSVDWTADAEGSEIFLVASGPSGVTYSLDVIFISGD
jgi:hypothetical protein